MSWDLFGINKKKVAKPSLDEIAMDDHLNKLVTRWIEREEYLQGAVEDSRLVELLLFNMKNIYSPNEEGVLLRNYLFRQSELKDGQEYTSSRLQDLYVMIRQSYPKAFIDSKHSRHIKSLIGLGYDVDLTIAQSFQYAWLLSRVQFIMRYVIVKPVKAKKA